MPQNWRHRKAAEPAVTNTENAQIGTPKAEFFVALRQLLADCDDPARPDRASYRALARVSDKLTKIYQPPDDPPCHLHVLSLTAISEILSGKRQGMPSFDWVASFVLSCQRLAVKARLGRRDQGTTILSHWADIYAAHVAAEADSSANGHEPGDRQSAAPAPLAGVQHERYQLPRHHHDFILSHGPYGRVWLARAQQGHPHARYRVALLMATDPYRNGDATALLIDVASTGHPLSLDLLDADHHSPGAGHLGRRTGGPSTQAAAQRAYELACAAWARGADQQADALCRAAARGGVPEAVLGLARALLDEIDPEAAAWLGQLGTEAAIGRHQARHR